MAKTVEELQLELDLIAQEFREFKEKVSIFMRQAYSPANPPPGERRYGPVHSDMVEVHEKAFTEAIVSLKNELDKPVAAEELAFPAKATPEAAPAAPSQKPGNTLRRRIREEQKSGDPEQAALKNHLDSMTIKPDERFRPDDTN